MQSSAQQMADAANGRVGVLTSTVANLDNYRPVPRPPSSSGLNRDNLTPEAKQAYDQIAGNIATPKVTLIMAVARSWGRLVYNYDLSQRRGPAQYPVSGFEI